jgi:tryptophanyl-tRNA synthetase
MASDILIQRANWVPVGKDQDQHLEMARVYAKRFNNFYGVEVFPEPRAMDFGGGSIKVPGLDGSGKMGKSEGNGIFLIDDEKTITKKVMRAVTDNGPQAPDSEKPEVIQNLFTLLELVSTADTVEYFDQKWNDCSIRYGDLKKQLAADICKVILPIRDRIMEISKDDAYLGKVVREGAEKARANASITLKAAKKAIGFRSL